MFASETHRDNIDERWGFDDGEIVRKLPDTKRRGALPTKLYATFLLHKIYALQRDRGELLRHRNTAIKIQSFHYDPDKQRNADHNENVVANANLLLEITLNT